MIAIANKARFVSRDVLAKNKSTLTGNSNQEPFIMHTKHLHRRTIGQPLNDVAVGHIPHIQAGFCIHPPLIYR